MLRVIDVGQVEQVPVFIEIQSLNVTNCAVLRLSLCETVTEVSKPVATTSFITLKILDLVVFPTRVLDRLAI